MSISSEEIENRVNYHAPSREGVQRHKNLADAAAHFLACIDIDHLMLGTQRANVLDRQRKGRGVLPR